jgi:hypothetical protein
MSVNASPNTQRPGSSLGLLLCEPFGLSLGLLRLFGLNEGAASAAGPEWTRCLCESRYH